MDLTTGGGEVLELLANWEGIPVLLAKPKHLGISTAWAYPAFRSRQEILRLASPPLPQGLAALSCQDLLALARSLRNNLLEYAIVAELRQLLLAAGVLGSLISGRASSLRDHA